MNYDNACKYLAEQYPAAFVRWLLAIDSQDIQILKTELTLEPIRADTLTFLQTTNQILHLEFQTLPVSDPPLPLRMLDYWVRLYRQYRCPIQQVVIFLTRTNAEVAFTEQFQAPNITHRYRVIRLWEQESELFLSNPALLPLATLTRTDSPRVLLEQVAAQVARIEDGSQRQNIAGCIQILAGLRYEKDLIRQLFREEIMQESVIYQDILQKGRQEGLQQGLQQEAIALVMRLLRRRFGAIAPQLQERIQGLSTVQLEELSEALLDFSDATDLAAWLERQPE